MNKDGKLEDFIEEMDEYVSRLRVGSIRVPIESNHLSEYAERISIAFANERKVGNIK